MTLKNDSRNIGARSSAVSVYISAIPAQPDFSILSGERLAEVEAVSSQRLKKEKCAAWQLLAYALKDCYSIDISEAGLVRSSSGKWVSDVVELSISHTDGAVAVAVSQEPVGVDIELVRELNADRLAGRIFSADELSEYKSIPRIERGEHLLRSWTAKEASFKCLDLEAFVPSKFTSTAGDTLTAELTLNAQRYIYSVCTSRLDDVRVVTVEL